MDKDEAIRTIIDVANRRLTKEEHAQFTHLGLAQPQKVADLMNLYLKGEAMDEDGLLEKLRDVLRGLRRMGVA